MITFELITDEIKRILKELQSKRAKGGRVYVACISIDLKTGIIYTDGTVTTSDTGTYLPENDRLHVGKIQPFYYGGNFHTQSEIYAVGIWNKLIELELISE